MSQTKISGHKRPIVASPVPSAKRLRVLEDVTNTNSESHALRSKMSAVADPNTRLMNKYYYGDPNVIEAVKVRERKIARDIQHFRKSIAEIDAETKLIRESELPNLKYDMSKKTAICNDLRKDLLQLTADLDEKNGECELQASNWELAMQHVQLQHEVNLQEAKNELDQKLNSTKESWQAKVREMERYQPDSGIIEEIEDLKSQKLHEESILKTLHVNNAEACESRDKELDQEFCKFVADKEMPLKELRDKHQAQKLNYERLTHETTTIDLEIKKCTDECSRISEQIVNLEALISECMSQQEILTDKKANAEAQYKSTALDTDKVQQKALVVEARYEDQFNRMEREQQRRRKLENSIDELRGKIRCFAYIGENVPDSCEVDYALKKIHMEDAPGCVFNRIIPQKLVSENVLIKQECEAYLEMCISAQQNCNIISTSTARRESLRDSFLSYLLGLGKQILMVQYVALSEKLPSSDLLINPESGKEVELQLTIKEDSIEMNSISVELRSAQDITEVFGKVQKRSKSGDINILKVEVWDDSHKKCDAYFLEANEEQTVKNICNLSNKHLFVKTPITIILQTLLLRTKSLFLCSLFGEDTLNASLVLELARNISQIDAPRKLAEAKS